VHKQYVIQTQQGTEYIVGEDPMQEAGLFCICGVSRRRNLETEGFRTSNLSAPKNLTTDAREWQVRVCRNLNPQRRWTQSARAQEAIKPSLVFQTGAIYVSVV
jgi:hypothetical protein